MKLFENIKDWWNSFLDDYHQSSTDKLVKKAFHKIIQSESNDRNSFLIRVIYEQQIIFMRLYK